MSGTTEQAEAVCKFCGGPDTEDDQPTNSGTCGWCYYGQRLDRENWEARLKAMGREVQYRGGCVPFALEGGGTGIMCRDPFEPKKNPS